MAMLNNQMVRHRIIFCFSLSNEHFKWESDPKTSHILGISWYNLRVQSVLKRIAHSFAGKTCWRAHTHTPLVHNRWWSWSLLFSQAVLATGWLFWAEQLDLQTGTQIVMTVPSFHCTCSYSFSQPFHKGWVDSRLTLKELSDYGIILTHESRSPAEASRTGHGPWGHGTMGYHGAMGLEDLWPTSWCSTHPPWMWATSCQQQWYLDRTFQVHGHPGSFFVPNMI